MHLVVNSVASALLADKRRDFTNNFEMRFIIWERSVQKKTDFWIVLCCILKEPKINMLEFSCWCKKNSQSIHEELHSIPLIFLNKKSEIWNDFTIFEKWKVKNFLPSLFSRSESENQMTQNRDREVNFQKNSREFSRIETLAGHWCKIAHFYQSEKNMRMYALDSWMLSCFLTWLGWNEEVLRYNDQHHQYENHK